MTKQDEKLHLLLFLNCINIKALKSAKGDFFLNVKHKFNKIVKVTNEFETDALRGLDWEAKQTYDKASDMVAEVLNETISHYNNADLSEFVEHCKNFKK